MKITDHVYALESTRGNYAYLVLGSEKILIDAGLPWQGQGILREIGALGFRPEEIRHIFLTHYDVDHMGGVALLQEATGASLWATETEIPYIRGERKRPGIKRHVSALMRVCQPQNIKAVSVAPGAGETLAEMRAIATPGHTPGHACFLFQDVLLAGDLVTNQTGRWRFLPSVMNWDQDKLAESLRKTVALSWQWICPAHGKPMERDERWERFIRELS